MKLFEKIKIIRKARGLSQEQLGYSLSRVNRDGISRQTISDWENGKFEPKLDNIRDLSEVLDVSFNVLLNDSIDLNNEQVLNAALNRLPIPDSNSISQTKKERRVVRVVNNMANKSYLHVREAIFLVISIFLIALTFMDIVMYIVTAISNHDLTILLPSLLSISILVLSIIALVSLIKEILHKRITKVPAILLAIASSIMIIASIASTVIGIIGIIKSLNNTNGNPNMIGVLPIYISRLFIEEPFYIASLVLTIVFQKKYGRPKADVKTSLDPVKEQF